MSNLSLENAIEAYRSAPVTPDSVTQTWRSIWENWGSQVGADIKIPVCDREQRELNWLLSQGRSLVYIPNDFAYGRSLPLLDKMFPKMTTDELPLCAEGKITNILGQEGWLDTEIAVNTNTVGLYERHQRSLKENNLQGMTLNTYIIAAQMMRLFSGEYFDAKGPGTVLYGSSQKENPVIGRFKADGRLDRADSNSFGEREGINLGLRTVGYQRDAWVDEGADLDDSTIPYRLIRYRINSIPNRSRPPSPGVIINRPPNRRDPRKFRIGSN